MLRFLLDLFVIFGCGYIGIVVSSGMDERIQQLKNLEQMLNQLAFNIGFLALPMVDAIRRTAESQQGAVKELLEQVTELMRTYPHITMKEAWEEAIQSCKHGLRLENEELHTLDIFAKYVGQGDKKEALDAIRLTSAKLAFNIEDAREKQRKDGKLYKGLGFLFGIFLVLVLA